MNRKAAVQQRRKLNGPHAEVLHQAQRMWAQFRATGTRQPPEDFPMVTALYYAALDDIKARGPATAVACGFLFLGRRYRLAITQVGMVKVSTWQSRWLIVQGPPGAV